MTDIGEGCNAWEVPTRHGAAWYQLRVWGHVLARSLRDLWKPTVRRHRLSDRFRDQPVVAERRTALWRDGRDDEFLLVAGKVHNLRLARRSFDGIFVKAGDVFSFWRQLGRPSKWQGFVEGREIRAGCVVPTIAGGLCQLSNALATCAVSCGFKLIERHGHTARIEHDGGSDNADAVDATVLWNYVDLRFVSDFDFRIEVELTPDELVVRIRANRAHRYAPQKAPPLIPIAVDRSPTPTAKGCLTCNETDCFRHRRRPTVLAGGSTAVLLNQWTPEFARLLNDQTRDADWFIPWVRPARRLAGWWTPAPSGLHPVALLASLRRTLRLQRQSGEGGRRQAALLESDRWLADRYAQRLERQHTHLLIDQSLLVPLAQAGTLGGRTYDVLVHALPAGELQRRLDAAAHRRPDVASLKDFRASDSHCSTEADALRQARRLFTPHAEVARHLRASFPEVHVESLDWILPQPRTGGCARTPAMKPVVAFAASALARKGAIEMAEAVRHLGWRLLVLGSPLSDPLLWQGIEVASLDYRSPVWLAEADIVALPAFIEHSPRALLAAIANDVPVVASRECGLSPSLGAIEVQAGDVAGLASALRRALESARNVGGSWVKSSANPIA